MRMALFVERVRDIRDYRTYACYPQDGLDALYHPVTAVRKRNSSRKRAERGRISLAELLELFLPRWRGDLHLNKPGASHGIDGGDGPPVVTSKRKAGSICQVSSLLRFYYPVYRPHPPASSSSPPSPSLFTFPARRFYTRRPLNLYMRIRADDKNETDSLCIFIGPLFSVIWIHRWSRAAARR